MGGYIRSPTFWSSPQSIRNTPKVHKVRACLLFRKQLASKNELPNACVAYTEQFCCLLRGDQAVLHIDVYGDDELFRPIGAWSIQRWLGKFSAIVQVRLDNKLKRLGCHIDGVFEGVSIRMAFR